jgi:(p)ppGpp synthase/HD superfamily hydrolase
MIPAEITLLLAIKLHGQQMRWGDSEPYVCHPIRVANAVYMMTKDVRLYQGALLHDAVEDTDLTLEDLLYKYNCPPAVGRIVDALTKRDCESREDYLTRLKAYDDRGISLIKMLDSFDNAMQTKSAIDYLKDNGRNPKNVRDKYIATAKELFELHDYGPTVTFHINNIFEYFENMEKLGFPEAKYDLMIDIIRAGVSDKDLI